MINKIRLGQTMSRALKNPIDSSDFSQTEDRWLTVILLYITLNGQGLKPKPVLVAFSRGQLLEVEPYPGDWVWLSGFLLEYHKSEILAVSTAAGDLLSLFPFSLVLLNPTRCHSPQEPYQIVRTEPVISRQLLGTMRLPFGNMAEISD